MDRGWAGPDASRSARAAPRIKPQADAFATTPRLAWQTWAKEVTVVIVIIAAIEAWVRRRRARRLAAEYQQNPDYQPTRR